MAAVLSELPTCAQLSSRVWRFLGLNPSKMTLQGTNCYLVGTGATRLLIDTGEGVEAVAPLFKDTMSLSGCKALSAVLITHSHHDHIGGIDQIREALGMGGTTALPVYKAPAPGAEADEEGVYHPLEDGQIFEVEGATLRVVAAPGHCDDHVGFWFEEERALFTGDAVLGEGSTVFTNLRTYMASLRKFLDLAPAQLYPAHGRDIGGTVEGGASAAVAHIEAYIANRQAREDQVVAFLERAAGGGDAATLEDLVADIYAAYPKTLWPAAGNSLLLHMAKLEEESRVVGSRETGWRLAADD